MEAVVDTGATMLVLPEDMVDQLALKKLGEIKVRHAKNKTEIKPIHAIVNVEMCGRAGESGVLAEPEGAQPRTRQTVLEQLAPVVDPTIREVIPNPRTPEMPMVETLLMN
jgi:predicted aspartyl protease